MLLFRREVLLAVGCWFEVKRSITRQKARVVLIFNGLRLFLKRTIKASILLILGGRLHDVFRLVILIKSSGNGWLEVA
jgi:hypothetical protein